MIKWSVVVVAGSDDVSRFARCVRKLAGAVDLKRTEIIISGHDTFIGKYAVPIMQDLYPSGNVVMHGEIDGTSLPILYNAGALQAQGEFICFVDDSVIVSDNFLTKMTYGLINYGKKYQSDDASLVVPMSNLMSPRLNINDRNVEQVQAEIDKQPERIKPWAQTSNYFRHCFLVKKDVWKGLDSAFEKSETLMMNDLSNRLLGQGHLSVFATDVAVWCGEGHRDAEDLFLKYYEKQVHPAGNLAILYRVKINEECDFVTFVKSLQKAISLGRVFVLDDNSKIKLGLRLKEDYPDLRSIISYEKFTRPYDEIRDWNELQSRALDEGFNWALCLEGDEILEDKVTPELLNKLINPVNPQVFGYYLHHYYFWNDDSHWRADDYWGRQAQVRLGRLLPNRNIYGESCLANVTGYFPPVPKENLRITSIRVKNYAFLTAQQRESRQELYTKIDPKNAKSYETLTSEFRLVRYEFCEESTASVYTPLKSGGVHLASWLDHVSSFFDEVVVGNDGLPPNDVKEIEMFGGKICLTHMGNNYAEGRNKIIKHCTQPWIMQLDHDERVENYDILRRMMDTPVDAYMFPIANLQSNDTSIVTSTIRLFRNLRTLEYWGYLHETVDDAARKAQISVSWSPTRLLHYGYLQSTPQQLWDKMQRYMEINMKQMEDFPMDGRSYFNMALHFLEDNLVNEGLRCLQIGVSLFQNPLVQMELGKTYLKLGYHWFEQSTKSFTREDNNLVYIQELLQNLKPLLSINPTNAPGHCISYFMRNPAKREWLLKHLMEVESKIATAVNR